MRISGGTFNRRKIVGAQWQGRSRRPFRVWMAPREEQMTNVSSYPEGKPAWVDLMAGDREAAMEFYRGLFGWDYEVGGPEFGNYTMGLVRGVPVAGIGSPPPSADDSPTPPVAWTTYLSVNDIDAVCERVTQAGGAVFMPPMDIADNGRMAIAADPTGAVFGMWQAGRHTGARVTDEPGTMCWHEVMTRDSKTAREFYTQVFGYDLEDLEGMDYSTLKLGDTVVGGLMGMTPDTPEEIPPHWMAYFAVEDTDAATQRVTDGGGAVRQPPFDTLYGRMAVVQDPQGAVFSIIKPSRQPAG
jgi:predicted enzyme related to lactoylglutathione lyase